MEAEWSARRAIADLEAQRRHLEEERQTVTPVFKALREKNHVAEALIKIIESSEK